jgi:hypothetical protein
MRRAWVACVLITAAFGAVYLLFAPAGPDLPAAAFRSDLFARAGFTFVDNAWYGSHNLPAYSVLAPPLGAWLGVRMSAAIAIVAAAALFPFLLERALPRHTTWPASILFALSLSATLFTDRIAFNIGLPLALAALLASVYDRKGLAVAFALLTPLASPVAGAFLALIGVSWTVASRRGFGVVLAIAGVVPIAVLNLLFPEGGDFPMNWRGVLLPSLLALGGVIAAATRDLRVLRVGAALYAVVIVFCFVVPNAAGANVARLIALIAAPLFALELWDRGWLRWLLVALVPATLFWSAAPSIHAMISADDDPTQSTAYFTPLNAELERIERRDGPIRVEIPFTRMHWEAARVADHVPIARGWLRQLDRRRNALFYEGTLTPRRYTGWLRDNAIGYVALPDAPLDFSAVQEAALVHRGLPALREVWHDAHWTLYRVDGAKPLGVTAAGPDWFTVRPGPDRLVDTRIRFSPHWAVIEGSGCVSRNRQGFTRVRATRPGPLKIGVRIAVGRAVFGRGGERCTG